MFRSSSENYVEEVNSLVNFLDISAGDATEIINIYFECFAENWIYNEYLKREIRIIRDTEENQPLIAELETIEDACLFEGDDYVMLTNYEELVIDGYIGDVLPNPSL